MFAVYRSESVLILLIVQVKLFQKTRVDLLNIHSTTTKNAAREDVMKGHSKCGLIYKTLHLKQKSVDYLFYPI